MIQTIEGRIGGGKTYTAMGWICNHLVKGGVVATNINIQVEPFTDQYGKKRGLKWVLYKYYDYVLKPEQVIFLSDSELIPYASKKGVVALNSIVMFFRKVPRGTPEQPVLVVIDEAHIHFPQDGFRSIPIEVLHFLTLSRHACVDVVFISQHIKNMWCQMLRLAQFRWLARDMKKYGIPVGLINVPWFFPHFLQLKFDYDGTTVMSRKFEWHKTYLYETYRSPELASAFESMPTASSVKVEKRVLTMNEKIVLFASGLAAGVVLVAIPACVSRKSEPLPVAPACVSSNAFPAVVVPRPAGFPHPARVVSPTSEVERVSMFFTSPDRIELGTVEGSKRRSYVLGGYFDGKKVVSVSESFVILQDSLGKKETKTF